MAKSYYISEHTVFVDVLLLSFAVTVACFSHIFLFYHSNYNLLNYGA